MTYRSESFRRAVASMPCVLCGIQGRTQAAHNNQIKDGKGMGIKSSDVTCMALCVECHRAIDQGGKLSKQERHALEDELNLKTLRQMVANELLVVAKEKRGISCN